ncbi:MAG: RidA family protein [Rhodospirillales bacterium]|nr:RidA family protein [Rhodospirillales bacterium]
MPRLPINLTSDPSSQPYSDGVWNGDTLLLSGRVAIGSDGTLIDGMVAEQTTQAIANIARVLDQADLTLADVVKTTVFLTSMDDYAAMNAAYLEAFDYPLPARSCVAVAGLPFGALVEIEVIAARTS